MRFFGDGFLWILDFRAMGFGLIEFLDNGLLGDGNLGRWDVWSLGFWGDRIFGRSDFGSMSFLGDTSLRRLTYSFITSVMELVY